MTEQQVVALMESSENEADWNRNCDAVKAAFGGHYPQFWFPAIVLSALMAKTLRAMRAASN